MELILPRNKPIYIMLSGLPGSGKTTWRNKFLEKHTHFISLSTDDYIERWAVEGGITYGQSLNDNYNIALNCMDDDLVKHINLNASIIHDQTNLSRNKRQTYFDKLPESYTKYLIVFDVDPSVCLERIANRKINTSVAGGIYKDIPEHVIRSMQKTMDHNYMKENTIWDGVFIIKE